MFKRSLNWLSPKPVFPSSDILSVQKRHQGLKIKRWDFRRSYKSLKTAVVSSLDWQTFLPCPDTKGGVLTLLPNDNRPVVRRGLRGMPYSKDW